MNVILRRRNRAIIITLTFIMVFTAAFWVVGSGETYAGWTGTPPGVIVQEYHTGPVKNAGTGATWQLNVTTANTASLPQPIAAQIQNLIDGIPPALDATINLDFQVLERPNPGSRAEIWVTNRTNVSFSLFNVSKAKMTMTITPQGLTAAQRAAAANTTYYAAMEFRDIDGGQAVGVNASKLGTSGYGDYIRRMQQTENGITYWMHKGQVRAIDESDDNGSATFGLNIKLYEPIEFLFETDSAYDFSTNTGTLFVGVFTGKLEEGPPATLTYITKDEKGRERFWASGGSANWVVNTKKGATLTAGNWTIDDLYLGSETTTEMKDGKIVVKETKKYSKRDGPNNVWYDDLARTKKTFGSNNNVLVYWPDAARGYSSNHNTYAKYKDVTDDTSTTQPDIPVPGLEILSAAADMDMSSGYEYRTDKDVIFSVKLHETGGNTLPMKKDVAETTRVSVVFNVGLYQHTVPNIAIPAGGTQIVWFKFHTPDDAQTINIEVTASFTLDIYDLKTETDENDEPVLDDDGNEKVIRTLKETQVIEPKKTFPVKITMPRENTPPDPRAMGDDGKSVRRPGTFNESTDFAKLPETTNKSWSVWRANWNEKDEKYDFAQEHYSAALTKGTLQITANDYVPTATDGGKTIKSGYGFDAAVETQVAAEKTKDVTPVQSSQFRFPEFNFWTYDRYGEPAGTTSVTASTSVFKQQFAVNKYSPHGQRVHYTPLWFPDMEYTVWCYVRDAWTPTGELKMNLSDTMNIYGNLYQDWHIAPLR